MKSKVDRSTVNLVDTRLQSQQLKPGFISRIPKKTRRSSTHDKGVDPTDRKRAFSTMTLQQASQTVMKPSTNSSTMNLATQQQQKKRTDTPSPTNPETRELLALITTLSGTETSRLIGALKKRKTETVRQTSVKKPAPRPNPSASLETLEQKITIDPEPVLTREAQPAEEPIAVKQEGKMTTELTATSSGNEAVASLAQELARRASRQELPLVVSHTSIILYSIEHSWFILSIVVS